ncbi:diguanylate cyclase (GGDEF) domain-containing protein [Noviherbaspirillum humi]|uniref:diguanylate cyclase n=1 Tax=Noviherbaspirillum humi TaxID=1688639 RepID=A0A239I9K5_9BURK|nr:GGDEF domain-containing protein [Noviherbaspirillum humi]SNS90265.1 diguanylate cyclase (GGDEF) domain-containing protein [Noviherbaspirillum humi]
MHLEVRTVYLMLAIAALAASGSLFLAERMKLSVQGIKHWAWGFAIAGLSGFPLAARGMISPALSVVLGNGMLLLGYSLIWTGTRQFVGAAVRTWSMFAVPLMAVPVLYFHFLDDSDVPGRLVLLSSLIALLSVLPAWELLRRNKEHRLGQSWVAWILLAHASFNIYRAAYSAAATNVGDGYAIGTMPTATGVEAFLFMMLLVLGLIIMMSNALQMELNRQASRDPLTDTLNRRAFHVIFESELSRSRQAGQQLSVLLMDIDNFKQLNDTHGHAVGDLALKHFVTMTSLCLRNQDILARFGGEEFMVLLPDANIDAAQMVAERIRSRLASCPLIAPAGEIPFTVSIGATAVLAQASDLKEIFNRADAALYQAKLEGRNRIVVG